MATKKVKKIERMPYNFGKEERDRIYNCACNSIAVTYGLETLVVSTRKHRGHAVEDVLGEVRHTMVLKTPLGIYHAQLLWFRVCPRPRYAHGCSSEAVIPMKIRIEHLADGNLTGLAVTDNNYEKTIFESGWADNLMETVETIYDHLYEAIIDQADQDYKKLPKQLQED